MNETTSNAESRWHKWGNVQVYVRRDPSGKPTKADAIDEDEYLILSLADRLQHAGYGVLRERVPRAGRVYHRLRAVWAGFGDPPENPLH